MWLSSEYVYIRTLVSLLKRNGIYKSMGYIVSYYVAKLVPNHNWLCRLIKQVSAFSGCSIKKKTFCQSIFADRVL